jgi:hypothetical protein
MVGVERAIEQARGMGFVVGACNPISSIGLRKSITPTIGVQ